MKKIVFNLILITSFVAYPMFKTSAQSPKLTASFNPMGFLFFGPALNVGYVVNQTTTLNFDIRRNSMGLLARAIRGNDPELYSFKGTGFAVGLTKFKNSVEEGLYFGGYLALDIQKTKYIEDNPWAWHETTKTIAILGNVGKRIKLGDKFYLNAGAVVGAGMVKFDWEYDDVAIGITDPEERSGNSFIPIGSLELAIGMFIL
ncbi:MAG: hypothetical protein H6605_00345 [Flavobacteriales bacterium]|nr:hypothetical protein [Flavobacteriales bacterium]